jgi:hypothetical protein
MKKIVGKKVIVWFFRDRAILSTFVEKPVYDTKKVQLEKFTFIEDSSFLDIIASNFYKSFGTEFYQIDGVVDKNQTLWVESINLDPDFINISTGGRDYLENSLLNEISAIQNLDMNLSNKFIEVEERETVYNKRMLKPLFDIIENF